MTEAERRAVAQIRLDFAVQRAVNFVRCEHHHQVGGSDGMLEQGTVAVKDMVTSQPWLDESFDFPVVVEWGAVGKDRPLPVGGSESARYSPSR